MRKEILVDNIYIRALKIGERTIDKGISYYAIIKELEIENKPSKFKENFRFWFFSNFYNFKTQDNMYNSHMDLPNELDNMPSFLMGDAFMKYLDYIELKEARQSALIAQKSAKKAHYIAVIAVSLNVITIIVPLALKVIGN